MSHSVDAAMRRCQFAGVSSMQLAFALAVATSDVDGPQGLLVGLHLLLALVGVAVLTTPLHPAVFMVCLYLLLGADFAAVVAIDEPLLTMAFAGATATALMPIMVFRGRWPIAVTGIVIAGLCLTIELAHPAWDDRLVVALATASVATSVGALVMITGMRRFAADADRLADEAEMEHRLVVSARAANEAATEGSRVLHDTVVNTLGALAERGIAPAEHERVRQHCGQELARLEAVLGSGAKVTSSTSWFDFDGPAMAGVHRSGLAGEELRRYGALLPDAVARAMHGCASEAVRNARKHSGSDRICLDVRRDDGDLVVEVVDDGVGFDGQIVAGRGLAESVFARAADHGIRVALDTAPGCGTRVTLRWALADSAVGLRPAAAAPGSEPVRSVTRRACWVWPVTIVVPGLLMETVNRAGDITWAHLMLGIVGALCALSFLLCRDGRTLPGWWAITLTATVPVTCLLALVTVDFGRDRAFLFQSAALTPLPVILLFVARHRRYLVAALGLLAATTASVLVVLARSEPTDAARAAMMVSTTFALLGAWLIFDMQFRAIGTRLADVRRHALNDRLTQASMKLSDLARVRWNEAGLQESLALLRSIADGTLDPDDADVRRRCGDEERYLRQITALTPDTALMSWWLALALVEAQARTVRLRVQAGSVELPDVRAGEAFGRLVLACLDTAAPGSEIVVSVFEHGGAPRLFVVGDRAAALHAPSLLATVEQCDVTAQTLDEQTLLEAVWWDRALAC